MTDKQIIIYKKECYNEPHCSLNQVLEQLNAYKMEAEEGKEINAELKAENEELNLKLQDYMDKYLHELAVGKIDIICKLKQTLAEIKEIIQNQGHIDILEEQILQKISEALNDMENN